nr:hypothetical protein [uncultured Lichenicoccus sp.]
MIVGVPQWKSDVKSDWHPGLLHGIAFTGNAHYAGERAATDTNNSFAPHYVTFDGGARYALGVLRHAMVARRGAVNVTDKHQYSSENGAGKHRVRSVERLHSQTRRFNRGSARQADPPAIG